MRLRKVGIIRADHINCGGDKREEVYLPDGCRYTSNIDERWLLLHSDKIVVLLAALYEEVLAVNKVVGGDDLVKGCELLLVERYAAALYELAHFALAGENLDIAPVLILWGRGEVAELVYCLTLIDWEPIRAIITSSEAEMEAWPFMALVSPSFIPLTL